MHHLVLEQMTGAGEYSYYGNGWDFTAMGVFDSYDQIELYLESKHSFVKGYDVKNVWNFSEDISNIERKFNFSRNSLTRNAHIYTYISRTVINDGRVLKFYDNGVWRVRYYELNTGF